MISACVCDALEYANVWLKSKSNFNLNKSQHMTWIQIIQTIQANLLILIPAYVCYVKCQNKSDQMSIE